MRIIENMVEKRRKEIVQLDLEERRWSLEEGGDNSYTDEEESGNEELGE